MRGLKIAAIAAVSLLLVTVLLVGYLFATSHVTVLKMTAQGVSAGNDSAAFDQVKTAVEEQTFQGTLFQKPLEWKEAGEYAWIT